ncbi:MAG: hypothetical protein K2X93_19415 [Candidatus Obscuribacterales bacterium]|nr:hypothetical protein [Candidatus Obscuribacterales bacterium]
MSPEIPTQGDNEARDKPTATHTQSVDSLEQYRNMTFGPESMLDWQGQSKTDDDKSKEKTSGEKNDTRLAAAYLNYDTGLLEPSENSKETDYSESSKVGQKPTDKMMQWMDKNFKQLDSDGDGKLTKEELGRAMLNPKLGNGEGAAYISTAYLKADSWSEAAVSMRQDGKGEPGETSGGKRNENAGITREDLKAIRDNLPRLDQKDTADSLRIDGMKDIFSRIDVNGDRVITHKELKSAMDRKDWSSEQRESLETLQKRFSDVSKASDDMSPVSDSQDFIQPERLIPRTKDGAEDESVKTYVSEIDVEKFAKDGDKFMNSLKGTLDYKQQRLKGADSQGETGSCFVLSPMNSMLEKNPNAIKNMIRDNKDGTSTVTFPGARDKPITVANPTEAERMTYVSGSHSAIIEKAYAKHLVSQSGQEAKYNGKDGKPATPVQETMKDGGDVIQTMKLLTGKDAGFVTTNNDKLVSHLKSANQKDQNVVAVSKTKDKIPEGSPLLHTHAFAVTGFDEKTNTVELKNPYSSSRDGSSIEPINSQGKALDGKNDGRFKMSLNDFKAHFGWVYALR